jgi:predicted RNA-binding Zn ribbon-like protein
METLNDVTRMRIVGGNLALDFVNTRSGPRTGPADDDILHGYDDLLAWAGHVGELTDPVRARLRRMGRDDPEGARVAYRRAIRVRDELDRLFRTAAGGRNPSHQQLAGLRDHELDALAQAELVSHDGRFRWAWTGPLDLGRPLWSVVHAAVELLTSGPLDRIKGCARCRFLFLDESKNRSRRWCSMDDCGTDEKISRYLARRAAARTAAGS